MHKAADELREAFRTLIRLHAKHGTIKVSMLSAHGGQRLISAPGREAHSFILVLCLQLQEDEDFEPAELWKLGPRDLSFWIASNFRENPQHQQVLLQARTIRPVQQYVGMESATNGVSKLLPVMAC